MAQHDYSIANQGFPATRADINNVLSAISTNNSGTSAPSTQFAGQFWIDTTSSTWTLYIHDGADDIQFATIDTSANTVNFIDSELGDNSVTTAKIADANVTSAKLVYPLTTFSSTGIDDNATSTAITIDSSENVGIGTTSPTAMLELFKAGTTQIKNAYSSTKYSLFGRTGGNYYWSAYEGGANLIFSTSASDNATTEAMRIKSNGAVLIGTTSDDPYGSSTETGQVFGTKGSLQLSNDDDGSAGNAALYINQVNTPASNTKSVRFLYEGTEVGSITTSSTGIGIRLGGTGTANTLDDYEEGTWSPAISGTSGAASGVSFAIRFGSYVKIGKSVTVQIFISLNSWSSGPSGNLIITTLPFTSSSTSTYRSAVSIGYTQNFSQAPAGGIIANSATVISLKKFNSTSAQDNMTNNATASDVSGNEAIILTATYETD